VFVSVRAAPLLLPLYGMRVRLGALERCTGRSSDVSTKQGKNEKLPMVVQERRQRRGTVCAVLCAFWVFVSVRAALLLLPLYGMRGRVGALERCTGRSSDVSETG
jgi:hypothetical protein